MWQRIQTVFLAIVALAMIASMLLPLWVYQAGTENEHALYALHYTVKEDGTSNTQYFPYALTGILAVAVATVACISISKYTNRLLQRKLGALSALFMAGEIFSAFYFSNQLMKSHDAAAQQYGSGFYLPVIAVIANFLANRFIMRDEKLVRDADRLR